MLGLVLQSRAVPLSDVGTALQYVEPLCAALCAGREDRETAVVPMLREAHARLEQAIEDDDAVAASAASRAFHEQLVGCSGNETMILIAGALETIWTAHEATWSVAASKAGRFPAPLLRKRALQEHEQLIAAIEAGDADRATRVSRKHLATAQQFPLADETTTTVHAEYLRDLV